MNSRDGKSQRREENRREEEERRKKKEERRKKKEKKEERRKKKEERRKKKEERRKKEEGRRKEKEEKTRKSPKKEDPGAQKGWKFATNYVFPMICGSGRSKSRLAKAAGAEPSGQMRDEKFARLYGAKHISKSKCTKHAMQKVHAVAAQSTFSKSKCTKHPHVRTLGS